MSLALLSSRTWETMKSEQAAHTAWHGYQNPLPMPSRVLSSYDFTPALPLGSSYHDLPENGFRVLSTTSQSHVSRDRDEATTIAPPSPLKSRPSYPSLKRSYATFKDSQNGQLLPEAYATAMPDIDQQPKPSIRPDNRLLCFGRSQDRRTLLDQYGRPSSTEINAQIHGMFFLSEMGMHSGDIITVQPELTCYRRNLFQISGSVTLPAGPLSILDDRGQTVKLNALEVAVSSTESVDGSAIRLIVIPWKTPPPNSPELPRNQEQEPAPISIFSTAEAGHAGNGEATARPIAWRRLQFRVATANNGRRKELQQHFVLRLSVTATLENGTKKPVAHALTAPIVVRGRSPRNFQARKEIPLLGSSASPRGQPSQDSPSQRKVVPIPARVQEQKLHGPDQSKQPFAFDASNFSLSQQRLRSGNFNQWAASQQQLEQATATITASYTTTQTVLPPYLITAQENPEPLPINASSAPRSQLSATDGFIGRQQQQLSPESPPSPSFFPFVDGNPRSRKMSRHVPTDSSTIPLYSSFEERIQPAYSILPQTAGQPISAREQFPMALSPESWSAGNDNLMYSSTMPPHPSHNYAYASDAFVKEDSHHDQYTWSAARMHPETL